MSSFYHKQEHIQNAKKVKQFYLQVLKQFSQRIQRQMRYSNRFINSQYIEQLEKRVKYKLQNPLALFQRFLNMKEGTTKIEYQIKNEINEEQNKNQVKEEYDQANHDYRIPSQNRIKDSDSQSQGNDLEEYQNAVNRGDDISLQSIAFRPLKSEVQVKKEQTFQAYKGKILQSQKQIKQQENQSENSNQALTNEQCEQSLSSIMLSTFNTSTLKHKPKEQKITISLDNTFLKSVYNQFYVGQVQVDINKIQKTEVSKQLRLEGDKKKPLL